MKLIDNLKTSVKLIVGFGLIAVLLVIVAVVGYTGMSSINNGMASMYTNNTLPIEQLGAAETALYTLRGDLFSYAFVPADRAATKTAILADQAAIKKKMDLYRASVLTPDEVTNLSLLDKNLATYYQTVQKAMDNVDAGQQETVLTSMTTGGDVANARIAVGENINTLIGINVTLADQLNVQGDATFTSSQNLLIGIGLLGLILALALALIITRSISNPLAVLTEALQHLQHGDLNRDMTDARRKLMTERDDEIGLAGKAEAQTGRYLREMAGIANKISEGDLTMTVVAKSDKDELGHAFIQMVNSLRSSVGQVAESAMNLGSASSQLSQAASQTSDAIGQISSTIQQVAAGNTQQSESVNQTAEAVEQMSRAISGVAKGAQEQANSINKASALAAQISQSVEQVSGNAQAVTHDSAEASRSAKDGLKTMHETIQGMETIKSKVGLSAEKVQEMGARSDQIGAIVETIEDIASQTNLLALNAAIEAARAGEHGKGFAVGADEVRKLAERASTATKELGGLIRGIQKTVNEAVTAMSESAHEVETGVVRANNAGQALESITKAAEAVYQQSEQASKAANQMKAAVSELVSVVENVSAVVEENTASTEEMSANATQVTQAIENIASVSEENSASAEEVSASAEEMSAQVEEVSASARSLEDMAQALQDVVSQFKLSADDQRKIIAAPKPLATISHPAASKPVMPLSLSMVPSNGKNGHHSSTPSKLNQKA